MILLHRMRGPESHPHEAAVRCPDLLASWLRHSPDSKPEHRDFEDWAENAHALHELALRGPVTLLPAKPGGTMLGDKTPLIASIQGAPTAIGHGIFDWSDGVRGLPMEASLLWNNADAVRRVCSYAKSPAFLRHAGRRVVVADMDMGQILDALAEIHGLGMRRVFVKSREKDFSRIVALGEDPKRLWRDCVDAIEELEWLPVSREGDKDAIIFQEVYKPTCEYRVIVVGERPIVGAGCIERFTPVDALGHAFDPRVEVLRGSDDIVDDPHLAERYRSFAQAFAAEWAAENGADCAYSLDLSVDAFDGLVKPIEMNPFMNLGLYANPLGPVFEAMIG